MCLRVCVYVVCRKRRYQGPQGWLNIFFAAPYYAQTCRPQTTNLIRHVYEETILLLFPDS
jgi:hypothetical protein